MTTRQRVYGCSIPSRLAAKAIGSATVASLKKTRKNLIDCISSDMNKPIVPPSELGLVISRSESPTIRSTKQENTVETDADSMSFEDLKQWLSDFEAKQRAHAIKFTTKKKAIDKDHLNSLQIAPSTAATSPTSTIDSGSPRVIHDVVQLSKVFVDGGGQIGTHLQTSSIETESTSYCSLTIKTDSSFRNESNSDQIAIQEDTVIATVSRRKSEDITSTSTKESETDLRERSRVTLADLSGTQLPEIAPTMDKVGSNEEVKVLEIPTEDDVGDSEMQLQDSHTQLLPIERRSTTAAAILMFGGSSKVTRKSIVEQRKDQLQRRWSQNKKSRGSLTTKVKWRLCERTGVYKKNYVVDTRSTRETMKNG